MFDVFSNLKKHVSTSGSTKPHVTSLVLFSVKLCMLMTLLAGVLVTAKTYIGDNIKCITGLVEQEHKAVESYCFISSTFTLVDLNSEYPHPGVGPDAPGPDGEKPDMTRHAYYQWVSMVLFLQGMLYYIPGWLWKIWDRGFFGQVIVDLDKIHIGSIEDKVKTSASYFVESMSTHRSYAIKFLICELLAFGISLGNLFFTNTFLGGKFFEFGTGSLAYIGSDASDINNPLNQVFPKIAKCTWHKFGPSGSIQKHDSMCVLPLNIVNEKTYIFLWLIYVVATAVMGVVLIGHLILFAVPNIRNTYLVWRAQKNDTKVVLQRVLGKCNYGDWFLMSHFKSNMAYFRSWVEKVAEELKK